MVFSIKSLSDLAGESVGVIFGTTAEKNLKNLVPTASIRGFKTYSDAYKALKSEQINAITSDDTILSRYVYDDSSVRMLPKRYSKELYAIGVRKDESSKGLLKLINLDITNMLNDGTLISLKRKWKLN